MIGGLYRSLGQEGESVAAAYALDYAQGDIVQPLIRNMGSILVAGAKPVEIFRQYMAKGDSPTRGRELNIHFGDPARDGFIGQISMLGDMIPVMAGITLAGGCRSGTSSDWPSSATAARRPAPSRKG